MLKCLNGESDKTIKNGHIHNGKQRFRCKNCGRQSSFALGRETVLEQLRYDVLRRPLCFRTTS